MVLPYIKSQAILKNNEKKRAKLRQIFISAPLSCNITNKSDCKEKRRKKNR